MFKREVEVLLADGKCKHSLISYKRSAVISRFFLQASQIHQGRPKRSGAVIIITQPQRSSDGQEAIAASRRVMASPPR